VLKEQSNDVVAAVPMRLMKRDLLFVAERWLYFWMFVAYPAVPSGAS
jgi:hypothetical protein